MKCTFQVGDQVVCLPPGMWVSAVGGKCLTDDRPVMGRIYTISRMSVLEDARVYLQFKEVRRTRRPDGKQQEWWNATCFRKVKKTDISVFQAMLAPRDESIWSPPAKKKTESV